MNGGSRCGVRLGGLRSADGPADRYWGGEERLTIKAVVLYCILFFMAALVRAHRMVEKGVAT